MLSHWGKVQISVLGAILGHANSDLHRPARPILRQWQHRTLNEDPGQAPASIVGGFETGSRLQRSIGGFITNTPAGDEG